MAHSVDRESPRLRIAVIGGGTGSHTVLSGLKSHRVQLTAIVSMADDGGSSGRLRDELGQLPPGDVRRCLIALSPYSTTALRRLFEYRFDRGQGLDGHNFGNLFLAALTEITGRTDEAIAEAGRLLQIKGAVQPVTLSDSRLVAELDDGSIILGETNIDLRGHGSGARISRVFLAPPAAANPAALAALHQADAIVIGPGDLYTSVLPNLLVSGIASAVRQSQAVRIYVCNVMTKQGETDGFLASDFVREILRYAGGSQALDHVIVNDPADLDASLLDRYAAEHSFPVIPDLAECRRLGPTPHLRGVSSSLTLVRHDPERLADEILRVAKQHQVRKYSEHVFQSATMRG
jgi:uncharacterized cofD-like protein